jgi:deoxycytidylate deaminase
MTSNIFDKVYSTLKDTANNSPILYKHCAAILKCKRIIGKPCCNDHNHGYVNNHCSLGSVHAEANVLLSFFGKDMIFDQKKQKWTISSKCKLIRKKIDIVVIRINANGDAVNSRPCYNCLKLMQDIEIRNVFYSTDSNRLICERVKDMISIQSSYITRTMYCRKNQILSTDYEFSDKIVQSYFPNKVKRHNLTLFIDNNSIPNYRIIIIDDMVTIKNNQGITILTSYIII